MSHNPSIMAKARHAFVSTLERLNNQPRPVLPSNLDLIQNPVVFWTNYNEYLVERDRQARIAALDAATATVAHALRIQAQFATPDDLERIQAVLRRAQIHYTPEEEVVVDDPDNPEQEIVFRRLPTAEIRM
jgi:hypothetical protein